MTDQITIAELCRWWNPVNNLPADTTRFGPLMTKAWHQEKARVRAKEVAAQDLAAAAAVPAAPPEPQAPSTVPAPVRRTRRAKVPAQDPGSDAGATA